MKKGYAILLAAVTLVIGYWIGFLLIIGVATTALHEYQIDIDLTTATVYENGRLVGSCPHGVDGIDSLILKDNK